MSNRTACRLLCGIVLLLLLGAGNVGAQTVRVLPDVDDDATTLSLAAGTGGILLAICDDFSNRTCQTLKLDEALQPIAEAVDVPLQGLSRRPRINLFTVESGFLLTAHDFRAFSMTPLGPSGEASGPAVPVQASPDGTAAFMPAYRDGVLALAHGDTGGFSPAYAWGAAVQSDDGELTSNWRVIAPKRIDRSLLGLFGDVRIGSITPSGNGFVVTWLDSLSGLGNGILIADLDAQGVPVPSEAIVSPIEERPNIPFAATVDRRQRILYNTTVGGDWRLWLATRRAGDRTVVDRRELILDASPLRVVGVETDGSSLGMMARRLSPAPGESVVVFYELTPDGEVLRGPIDTPLPSGAGFGTGFDFAAQPGQSGYLFTWAGDGPEGPGVYVYRP
ncbi:hypothetical protein ABI59_00575 [Acidobacteria bacterium Mor1]|nr:hypothetical protein ABI59_00575 [Acidobacteria bacterium Mor1]